MLKKALRRIFRIISGKNGVWCKKGKKNFFCKPVHLYEECSVGNYNYFGPYVMMNNAIIGNYCSFGPGVKVGQGKHSIDYITTYQSISGKLINHSLSDKSSVIENDVWIGANAVVMQGVRVGTGAVIGANAVVTRDVPPYAIVVGVPARVIRYRFDESKITMLLNSRWWEKDFDEACEIIGRLAEK